MRRPSPVLRIAAALLIAGLIAPAPGSAADDDADAAAADAAAADAAAAEEAAPPPPAPVAPSWSDTALRNTNAGIDLIVIRPASAITLLVGAVLFVPAALLTAPNGWESVQDAYQRFVGEPSEYLVSRPLGEL